MSATATARIGGGPAYTEGALYTATADPTVSNDSSDNKLVGDIIVNTTTGLVFVCASNSLGAAVWNVMDVDAPSYTWTPASAANQPFYVCQRGGTVLGILACVEIAGTGGAATGTVVKAASGTALSSGTALHTGTINLVGTAATNQTPTLAGASTLQIAAGTRIGFQTTGTLTSAIGTVTVLILPN